jgi:hypothetical protein
MKGRETPQEGRDLNPHGDRTYQRLIYPPGGGRGRVTLSQ